MLARRFAIVCLMAAVFGMGFSTLVANTGRASSAWNGALPACGAPCAQGALVF